MRIAFDHQVFTLQSFGGISRYFSQLAKRLAAQGDEIEIFSCFHQNHYLDDMQGVRVHGAGLKKFPPKSTRLISQINDIASRIQASFSKPDILHETYYGESSTNIPTKGRVVTVYDMIHEKFPHDFPRNDLTSQNKKHAVERADQVICISHSTKVDLCELFNTPEEKVSVVHLGFEKFEETEPIEIPIFPKPYLLYVGGRSGYKNFSGLLHALASNKTLKSEFDIVAFGGGAFSRPEIELQKNLGFNPKCVHQFSGSDKLLGSLYRGASAFVYPSLYEGFGLPPLEAMAHNCPVITSNTSSMPEVIGPAGEYFKPTDHESQAHAICNVVFDTVRRGELILAGKRRLRAFSWERCANETREIYSKILNGQVVS